MPGLSRIRHRLLPGLTLLMMATSALALTAHWTHTAAAASSVASLQVIDTSLAVRGKTAPSATVSFTIDDSPVGTTVASAGGEYSKIFTALVAGIHTLKVTSLGSDSITTAPASLSVNLTGQVMTEVDMYVAPSITIEPARVVKPGVATVKGQSYPGSTIFLVVSGKEVISTPVAVDGSWSVRLSSALLTAGSYSVTARSRTANGEMSYQSSVQTMTVVAGSLVPSVPPPAPTEQPPIIATEAPGQTVDVVAPPSDTPAPSSKPPAAWYQTPKIIIPLGITVLIVAIFLCIIILR